MPGMDEASKYEYVHVCVCIYVYVCICMRVGIYVYVCYVSGWAIIHQIPGATWLTREMAIKYNEYKYKYKK